MSFYDALLFSKGQRGERGYSAYEIAVQEGYEGTQEEWANSFLSPTGYYNKNEVGGLLEEKINYTDIIDNLLTTDSAKVLSAKQGKLLNDDIIAINTDNGYYDEIVYTKERFYETDCYFTTIPKYDNDNNEILLYIGVTEENSSPTEYARKNFTTLTTNATLRMNGTVGVGSVIANGEIIRDIDTTQIEYNAYTYLGLKANRQISEYQVNETSAEQMLNDGCLQAWCVYYPILKNSTILDMTNVSVGDSTVPTSKNPRQCLGQKADGTIIILTCDGRTDVDAGLTSEQTAELLLNKGCINAWNLDGGGSSSTTIRGSKLNRNIDGNGTKDRFIGYTLNVKKQNSLNTTILKAFSKIGEEKQNLIKQFMPYINDLYKLKGIDLSGLNANELIGEIIIGYGNSMTNIKTDSSTDSVYFINIPHSDDTYKNTYNLQICFDRRRNSIYYRKQYNGTFYEWEPITSYQRASFHTTNNTILAKNTYQKLNISESNIIRSTANISIENTNKNELIIDNDGYVKISCNGQFNAVTSGKKWIKIVHGNTDVHRIQFSAKEDEPVIFNIQALIQITSTNAHNVSVQIYGEQDDTVTNTHIYVDCDR